MIVSGAEQTTAALRWSYHRLIGVGEVVHDNLNLFAVVVGADDRFDIDDFVVIVVVGLDGRRSLVVFVFARGRASGGGRCFARSHRSVSRVLRDREIKKLKDRRYMSDFDANCKFGDY